MSVSVAPQGDTSAIRDGTKASTQNQRGAHRISSERAAALAERLSRCTNRPEYLQTPGPYPVTFNPERRRIPFVFRTNQRFPPPPPAPSDALDCNLSLVRERPVSVVTTTEPRFLRPKSATAGVRTVYEVDRAIELCSPKTPVTLLPPHCSSAAYCSASSAASVGPKSPLASTSPPPSASVGTVAWGSAAHPIQGGSISDNGTRDVLEFLVRKSDSPGPIYNPSFDAVRGQTFATRFSTQPRLLDSAQSGHASSSRAVSPPAVCSRCNAAPSDEEGHHNLHDLTEVLSTWTKAPVVSFGKPSVPFVHPNRFLSPPPPEEVQRMLDASRERRASPATLARLSGCVINATSSSPEPVAEAPDHGFDHEGSVEVALDAQALVAELVASGVATYPHQPAESGDAPAKGHSTTASKSRRSGSKAQGSLHQARPTSAVSVDRGHGRVDADAAMAMCSPFSAAPIAVKMRPTTIPLQIRAESDAPAATEAPRPSSAPLLFSGPTHRACGSAHQHVRLNRRRFDQSYGHDCDQTTAAKVAVVTPQPAPAASSDHPILPANDYMQLDVMKRIAEQVRVLYRPSEIKRRRVRMGGVAASNRIWGESSHSISISHDGSHHGQRTLTS